MEKKMGLAIVVMVAVVMGGFAYANIPQTGVQQNTAIPNEATSIAFENHGNSWKHVVAAFDITDIDGSVKQIYADLWVKPQGTATVDLSSLAGLNNQALPEGTKINLKTYTVPNVPASQVPQGITDNKVTTTADPSEGGQYLAALTPGTSAADPVVVTPGNTVIADPVVVTPGNTVIANTTSISISTGGRVSASTTAAAPICAVASAGGTTAQSSATGPTIASTPRITIVLPSI